MSIKLYHCLSARSFRPLWMLEELRLAYELIVLPFPPRALQRSYLDVNPLGTIPLFEDGPVRMTESAAICQYLADKAAPTPLRLGPEAAEYGAYLNFLHFGEATLTFPQTLVLRYGRFEPDERKLPEVADAYAKWFLGRLRTLEPHLAAREYLVAGRFTAADVSVGYALMLAELIGLDAHFLPAVAAYWQRLKARPAYERALTAQITAAEAQGVSTVPAPQAVPA